MKINAQMSFGLDRRMSYDVKEGDSFGTMPTKSVSDTADVVISLDKNLNDIEASDLNMSYNCGRFTHGCSEINIDSYIYIYKYVYICIFVYIISIYT